MSEFLRTQGKTPLAAHVNAEWRGAAWILRLRWISGRCGG